MDARDMAKKRWTIEEIKQLVGDDPVDVLLNGFEYNGIRGFDEKEELETRILQIASEAGIRTTGISKLIGFCPDLGCDPDAFYFEPYFSVEGASYSFRGNLNPKNHLIIAKHNYKEGIALLFVYSILRYHFGYQDFEEQPPFRFLYVMSHDKEGKDQFRLIHPEIVLFQSGSIEASRDYVNRIGQGEVMI